ncbi:MAG: BON domain-containing protein [Planctomycetaceae bacterium]|nr:BON domain-containing protein [Planctomycetaceae bacterium]
MMKKIVYFIFLLYFFCPIVFAQQSDLSDTEIFPSIDEMMKSLTGEKSDDISLERSIENIMDSMTQKMQSTTNTADSVKSAVEGTLVVEEVIPETNRTVVETVDTKTKRYSPRLKLNFAELPLRPLSGKIVGVTENNESADLFEQTNIVITHDIARRIQGRLRTQEIQFEFKNRTARLSGTVKTSRQRELAEMMLRMEPGIDHITNDLVVENALRQD